MKKPRASLRRFLLLLLWVVLSVPTVAQERGGAIVEWAPDGNVLIAARGLLGRFSLDSPQEELLDKSGVTFALSPDGTVARVFPKVRVDGHVEKVLAAI